MTAPSAPGSVESALALIAEMTRTFASTRDIDAALVAALDQIVEHLDAEVGSFWLVEDDEIVCHASVGPDPITGLRLPRGEGIIGRAVKDRCCQRVLDVQSDPGFSLKADDQSGFTSRSLLCAPLAFGDRVLGAIEVVNRRGGDGHFDEHDVHPLEVMASSAALAIANARMARAQVEHERVRHDIELAAELQKSLLPRSPEADFPLQGRNFPARTVSGDFYDHFPIDESRIAFCLGDVSGKGINAALLMAKAASLYRLLARTCDCTATMLRSLNDELHDRSVRGMFVTMLAGVYDTATGRVTIANAGHEPAVLREPGGAMRRFDATAPPLGVLPSELSLASLEECAFDLGKGALYVYSDGLTEALDEHGEQFGLQGLERLAADLAEHPPRERVDLMLRHVRSLDTRDDLTLLCLDATWGSGP